MRGHHTATTASTRKEKKRVGGTWNVGLVLVSLSWGARNSHVVCVVTMNSECNTTWDNPLSYTHTYNTPLGCTKRPLFGTACVFSIKCRISKLNIIRCNHRSLQDRRHPHQACIQKAEYVVNFVQVHRAMPSRSRGKRGKSRVGLMRTGVQLLPQVAARWRKQQRGRELPCPPLLRFSLTS